MELDYSKDSLIDVNSLDIEWLNQPELERKYIQKAAELKKEAKLAHENLKTVRSELIRDAHADPEKCCGVKKATAPQVEAYYRTHEDYIDAKREQIDTEDAAEVANNMKDLIHFTRAKALEELVNLHGQGYFAGPKTPRNINREIEKREEKENSKKETSKKIGTKLRRTKKSKKAKKE